MADTRQAEVAGLKIIKLAVWLVYAFAVTAAVVMGFAFFLLLLDANTKAPFVSFVYDWGVRFAAPFAGMIEPVKLSNGGTLSWSALFAIAVYLIVATAVASGLNAVSRSIYRTENRPSDTAGPTTPGDGRAGNPH